MSETQNIESTDVGSVEAVLEKKSFQHPNHTVHGRWVKTSTEIPGAHKAKDGKSVGIYQAGREPASVVVNGKEVLTEKIPTHVAFATSSGHNLMRQDELGNSVKVCCDPADLEDLEACVYPDDLPQCPRNAHLFAAA